MKTTDNGPNLDDILSRPVVGSVSQPSFELDPGEPIESAVLDPEPEPEPGFSQMPQDDSQFQPGDMPTVSFADCAESIIDMIDGLQSSTLPFIRERKVFTQREREILDGLDTTGGTIYPEGSPEKKVLNKWNRHLQVIEKIPFTERERRMLVNGTARYCQQTNLQMSPLETLLMSFAGVATRRFHIVMQE